MNLLNRRRILTERTKTVDKNFDSAQQDFKEIEKINSRISEIRTITPKIEIQGATPQESKDVSEVFSDEKLDVTESEKQEVKEDARQIFFEESPLESSNVLSENLVINEENAPFDLTPFQVNTRNVVKSLAKTGAKSIQKLFPDTKIILHESSNEYEKFATKNSKGEFVPNENIIHIDLNKAVATTVPHEIFHATLFNKIKTDENVSKLANTLMISVRKALPKKSEIAKRIDSFALNYDEQSVQNEERLAELMGILASDYDSLAKPEKNKIIKFIQDVAKAIGIDINFAEFTKQDSDVIDLLNTLSSKVTTGEDITEADIKTLEELDNGTNPIGNPTEVKVPKPKQQKNVFKEDYPLSLVTPDKKN